MLAGGSLGAWPTPPLLRSVLVGALAGRLDVGDAVAGALLGLDLVDGRADSLSVSPLSRVAGLRAKGPLRVGDLVAAPVVLDLGGGLAPGPPAPSRVRHRANRGGDRQANAALYRIVLVRLRYHQPTKDYLTRRLAEGKPKNEIIRCLKRYIAREVFAALQPLRHEFLTPPT